MTRYHVVWKDGQPILRITKAVEHVTKRGVTFRYFRRNGTRIEKSRLFERPFLAILNEFRYIRGPVMWTEDHESTEKFATKACRDVPKLIRLVKKLRNHGVIAAEELDFM